MTTAAESAERLPLSKKAVAAIAAANSWEQDRVAQAIASGRRGWIAAGVGAVLAVLGFGMATFQSLRPPPARSHQAGTPIAPFGPPSWRSSLGITAVPGGCPPAYSAAAMRLHSCTCW